jgi:hypothetical protein
MNLEDSNKYIIDLIKSNQPFTITRLGTESYPSYLFTVHKRFGIPSYLSNNAGIYSNNNNDIAIYYLNYFHSVNNSDSLAIYLDRHDVIEQEKYFIKENQEGRNKLKFIIHEVLEPFYCLLKNEIPWTHHLLGKKVLIISPFVDSFKKQLTNNFQMFKGKDKKIFLDNQEFIFYKCFNTVSGNHLHKNWIETFNIMCSDIQKLDFDIALISCGGYALLLGSFIKKINKSAIYIGGGLQILFGVIGRRWETNEIIKKIIKENKCKFIRPSGNEIPNNCNTIEGGCYW